ncbi:alpha/beta fold hydrolase [Kitasatospora sp. NA04385]|uniref:alpha/beta fold hydrolase n=1 Tax=Kitasatospora sp. NA04385 TaxID=2742135 RepID=UPI001590193E|nr:alpha/beta fold hydrolase [Kitasatospora sp. NA04385]QKW19508.1 alpha/beta fold hydrolase [Kitasatospora sp. NA04385]
MELHTHEWGTGGRTALLVHGIQADHRTWRVIGPALAERGYRVVAVDLRGHGASPRGTGATPAERYGPELFAEDLVDTLPAGADLAIGHSMGALALHLAVERLKPARAVYSDPAFVYDRPGMGPEPFVDFKRFGTRDFITGLHPDRAAEDVDAELAALALWDTDTALGLWEHPELSLLPRAPVVPSLVQLADPSGLVPERDAAELRRRGFEVRTVPGAGHCIHRDDPAGFLASLDGWI